MAENAVRTRNWACEVYPDSAPEGWLGKIAAEHIPAFVSPLHDRDVKEDGTGELKKPHHHVLMMFTGVKTEKQARSIAERFGAANGHVEAVNDSLAYGRYLCHLDEPENGPKVRYDPSEVIAFGGLDYGDVAERTADDRARVMAEMQRHVREYNVCEVADLCDWAASHRRDWYRVLCQTGSFTIMRHYIASVRHSQPAQNGPER